MDDGTKYLRAMELMEMLDGAWGRCFAPLAYQRGIDELKRLGYEYPAQTSEPRP